ncbi:ankyrin repeat-containing domain protein [Coprinopsis sp. MPI-PUGE-AT-0042]|nr:ankyrin repeat-containing domain protein [Coprinopsis sp. MPI-PUGE-AT-0042]
MGAILSKLAGWDTAPVEPVLASEAPPVAEPVAGAPPIQPSGPAFVQNAQGAQNFLAPMHNPTFIQNNQQGASTQDPEHLRKVLDFLSLVNFRNIQQENHGNWMPDTLKWFLEGSMYQWWLETQGAIVWGTGMPGAGKTILASVAIQDSEDHALSDICIGYVYCRYTEPMKVRDILAALVRQILERYPHHLPTVKPLYTKHDLQRTSPTQSELVDVIRAICKSFKIARLFIDGLDEALYDEQFDLLATLKSVPANFFITSRPLLRLNDVLPDVKMFDIAAQNTDIELLVSQHIDRNPDLRQMLVADEQRVRVIKKICQSSHGMFLHASLMVEAVSHCISAGHIMEQLDKLPAKLDVLYEATFSRIEAQSEERAALAKRALLWVVYAFEPLSVDDLRYAVACDPKLDWHTPERLVPESLLISICCGLVTVEGDWSRRVVRLVHYTALDALKRILLKRDTSPHCLITELCVERLIDYGIPARQPNYQPYGRNTQPPLLEYAYNSWHRHAKESIHCPAEPGARPVASMLRFLSLCTNFPSGTDVFTAPTHLVAEYGLPSLLPLIDPQVNKRTEGGRSALSLAACKPDVGMIGLLLNLEGVDPNLQDEDGNTALMLAASEGLRNTVKVLLRDPRIDIHMRNKKGETALHCAIPKEFFSIRLLIDRGYGARGLLETALLLIATPGIDVNASDQFGRTPLMLAYDHAPQLLNSLAQHPNIDLLKRDKDGQTLLMHACRRGESSAVQWYLQLPGVDAVDNSGASALAHRAQYAWHEAYEHYLSDFQALVAAGLDVNHRDEKGLTALAHAVQVGSTHAIRALLQLEGVDVNLEDREGRSLLMVACDAVLNGTMTSSDFARLLKHSFFDINAKNSHGTTALAYTVARGVLETAKEILSLSPKGLNELSEPLYEVHQLGFRIHHHKEHLNDLPSEVSIDVTVTGTQWPHFPQFRLPYRGTLRWDHRHALEQCGSLQLPSRILKKHTICTQLLLNHPDINDHGLTLCDLTQG